MGLRSRAEVAEALARWHFAVEQELTKILWIRSEPEDETVRLLEVATQRSGIERGVEVFAFDRTKDVPYPTEVAEITERELKLVVAGVLPLPLGWSLNDAKVFTRDEYGASPEKGAAE